MRNRVAKYMLAPELADLIGVTPRRAQQIIASGKLPGVKRFGSWIVPRDAGLAFVEERRRSDARVARSVADLTGLPLRGVQARLGVIRANGTSPAGVAALLIACTGADSPARALEAIKRYGEDLTPTPPVDFLPGARSFGDALTHVLSEPELAARVQSVELCRTAPEAIIYVREYPGGPITGQAYRPSDVTLGRTTAVRRDVTIPGAILHQLALDFTAEPAAWVSE